MKKITPIKIILLIYLILLISCFIIGRKIKVHNVPDMFIDNGHAGGLDSLPGIPKYNNHGFVDDSLHTIIDTGGIISVDFYSPVYHDTSVYTPESYLAALNSHKKWPIDTVVIFDRPGMMINISDAITDPNGNIVHETFYFYALPIDTLHSELHQVDVVAEESRDRFIISQTTIDSLFKAEKP